MSIARPPASERRLLTHGRARLLGRLDDPWSDLDLPLPTIQELVTLAQEQPVVLWGGEPTLRADLPTLLQGLVAPTLRTDGLALSSPAALSHLVGCGLAALRLPLASGRRDANDWLMGRKGVTRPTIAAARGAIDLGLQLEIEIVLTRPTAPHVNETVELAAHLGASAVRLRRLARRGPAYAAFVALSPRYGLMEPWIDDAVRTGRRAGLDVQLDGLPRCAAPQAPPELFAPAPTWLTPADPAWAEAAARLASPAGRVRCPGCSPTGSCAGAPDDYTALFGDEEFRSEGPSAPPFTPASLPPGVQAPTIPPPPRGGRAPATRLRAVHQQLSRGVLSGDPLAPRTPEPLGVVGVGWSPDEPSRAVRVRLVRASQEGGETLRIEGGPGLRHPAAAALLRDATRLSVPRLELRGELSGLQRLSDDELRRLRRFSRAVAELRGSTPQAHDAAVGTPGAFDATADALQRLHRATRRRVEIAFAAASPWDGPELPAPLLPIS